MDIVIKPFAKAWVAFAGALLLVADQEILTEVTLPPTWATALRIVQVVLIFATAGGVYRVPNAPSTTLKQ